MNKLGKVLHDQYLTKSALARELTKITGKEISRQRVNNWTQGINKPNDNFKKIIADFLKVTIDELFFSEYEGYGKR